MRCWLAAKEPDRAAEALRSLDEDVVPGDVFFDLGKLYVQRADWTKAREPLALSLGRDVHSHDKEAALQALGKAERRADSASCAQQWLGLVKRGRPSAEATCPP